MNISKNFRNDRKPTLIVDSKNILKSKKEFSARATILGFSIYAKDWYFY